MQLRKRKPVNYSDDHALFSKFLSETEDIESSDSDLFSMGNVNAHGKRKEENGALSEGDVEGAPRSWGSFHLRSVIGGRRGQNSNQDDCSDDMVKLSRKRKVEESPQTVRGWEYSARTLSFRETYSYDTSDYIR